MGSVYNEIERIENAKSDIETAIEECGVDVPDTELIDTYSTYVRQIPSAVFSSFNVDAVGGTDKYIQSIKQVNGLIETTVGGLVSTSSSGLVPKADASSGVIDTQSTDWVLTNKNGTIDWYKLPESAYKNDKVTQTITSTSNTAWRPLLLGYSYSDATPFAPTTVTNTVYASHLLKVQPSTGTINSASIYPTTTNTYNLGSSSSKWANVYATTFTGNLTGNASSATKLGSSTVGASNRPIYLNAGTPTACRVGEAFLTWGGADFKSDYGCIDAAMVPLLGANRLAFLPAECIAVEYSTDAGTTWVDYGATDSTKIGLVSGLNAGRFQIGGTDAAAGDTNNMLRIIINSRPSSGSGVYTTLNKFVLYLMNSSGGNAWCTIEARTQANYASETDTWELLKEKISVSGWPGYNIINYATGVKTYSNATSQYREIRFTFGIDSCPNTNSIGLVIYGLMGYGGFGWITPSNMAKHGHLYSYNTNQTMILPAGLYSSAATGTVNLGDSTRYWNNTYTNHLYIRGTGSNTTSKITSDSTTNMYFNVGGVIALAVLNGSEKSVRPGTSNKNTISLGTSTVPWGSFYANDAHLSKALTLTGITKDTACINFSRSTNVTTYGYNYITAPTGGTIAIEPGLSPSSTTGYHFTSTDLRPGVTNTYNLGTSTLQFNNIYGKTLYENGTSLTSKYASFNHPTSQITALTGYTKASEPADLVTTDTLNTALGKLETKADLGIVAYNWYKSVTEEDSDTVINKWDEIVGFIDSVTEGTDVIDEFVTRKTNQDITGIKTFYTTRDVAPFNVASSTVVTYLNADLLDGKHASDFALPTDIPTVTDYYWANVNIKDFSDTTTKPVFSQTTASIYKVQSRNTGTVDIRCGTNDTNNYTLYLPGDTGQLVYHTNDTAVGSTSNPVYIAATGQATACTVSDTTSTLYLVGVTSTTSGFYSGTKTASGVRIVSGNKLYAYGGFFESSDNRLKNFRESINVDLEKLSQLPKKYFTWKSDSDNKIQIGTSAQELQKLYPELVNEDEEGLLNVAYDKLSIIALAAIDKLHSEYKQKISILEKEIATLKESLQKIS